MEDATRSQQIETINNQIASCETEVSDLAREALCSSTPETRRIEALVRRAALQTRIAVLAQELEGLEAQSVKLDRSRDRTVGQNGPWPNFR